MADRCKDQRGSLDRYLNGYLNGGASRRPKDEEIDVPHDGELSVVFVPGQLLIQQLP